MIVYVILDTRRSPNHALGDAIDTFIRGEDAERFIEEVRGDDRVLASDLRIEERELEAGRVELAGDAGNGTRLANDHRRRPGHQLGVRSAPGLRVRFR